MSTPANILVQCRDAAACADVVDSSFSDCHPIKGIRDIGSFFHPVWKMPAGVVAGRQWTLDEVEGYLRNPQPFK